jgi:signal transduction histidine kinase
VRYAELARRYAFDAIAVALGVAFLAEIWTRFDEHQLEASLLGVVATVALLARRVSRLGAGVTVLAAGGILVSIEPEQGQDTAAFFILVLVTAWLLGGNEDRRGALIGLGVTVATVWYVTYAFGDTAWTDYLWITGMFGAAWTAGYVIAQRAKEARHAHERAKRMAVEREDEALRAVQEERQRIARELHDVVAHSISVMTVQAGGVRRLLLPEQQREREALQTIEETGRQALAEMRRLLGILKGANETAALAPQPSLLSIEQLLAQVREAGLPVVLEVEGEQIALPPGVDLSAYRIVQEALTNALKHAGPARAAVKLCYRGDCVELEVTNDGRAVAIANGDGQGVAGMRERVAVFGGTLQSGPRHDGSGYVVRAKLPIREDSE